MKLKAKSFQRFGIVFWCCCCYCCCCFCVSDRGNKGMASSTFLADWLSTHFEPKDETEGEVVSKVVVVAVVVVIRRH